MADPAIGALTAAYQSLAGKKAGGLVENIIEGFAKGVDTSFFNLTNFKDHLSASKAPLKTEAKEIGRLLDAASVDGVVSSGVKAPDSAGLRRRKGSVIE